MVKSKYIVFPEARQIDVWEEDIAPPEAGEILCRAEKSLISIGTELHCLNGTFEHGTNWFDWVKYPFRPGYSMVGEVVELGQGVRGVSVGDRIASYDVHQQYYKIADIDHALSAGRGPFILPDAITSEEGTWRSLAGTTQNAVRRAKFEFGESVGVVGLGILGQLTTQYLSAAGAKHIIAIDKTASRLELARQSGATHILQMDVKEAIDRIEEITGAWMLDVVVDVTGLPTTLASSIQLVRELGRVVLLGDTPVPSQQHLGPGVVSKAIAILGIHGYTTPEQRTSFAPWTAREMSDVFFTYLQRGTMNMKHLVTHRYSPLDAPSVYQTLLENRTSALGVILDWTKLDA